ncbi:hypothetical protein SRHO_G00073800 [Serrasalmus rhombeus]
MPDPRTAPIDPPRHENIVFIRTTECYCELQRRKLRSRHSERLSVFFTGVQSAAVIPARFTAAEERGQMFSWDKTVLERVYVSESHLHPVFISALTNTKQGIVRSPQARTEANITGRKAAQLNGLRNVLAGNKINCARSSGTIQV